MNLFATSFTYGSRWPMTPTEVFFHDVKPILIAGFVIAFFLSRWSPFPVAARSRLAIGLSTILAIVVCGFPRLGIIYEDIYCGALAAFGLVFAASRIRTVPNNRTVGGWICAVIHALQIVAAWSALMPRGRR